MTVVMAFLSHHSGSLSIASVFAFDSGDEGVVFSFFLDGLRDLDELDKGHVNANKEVDPSILISLGISKQEGGNQCSS